AQAGDSLTISGTNLTGASTLKLGAVALLFGVDSATQLSATLPSSALTGSLTVTTPAGTSAGLTLPVRPTIASFTPSSGPAGTSVTITGKTLSGVAKITFGSSTSGTITPVSNTQVKVTVPAGAVTGPITV